jgi:hypothetical protein
MLRPCGTRDELAMSWSPDGTSLALTTGAARLSSPSHIDIVDISSGVARPVTNLPAAHIGDTSAAFPGRASTCVCPQDQRFDRRRIRRQVGSSENPRCITSRQHRCARSRLGARRLASDLFRPIVAAASACGVPAAGGAVAPRRWWWSEA